MSERGYRVTYLIRALDKFFKADDWNRRNPDKVDHKRFQSNVVEPLDKAWSLLNDYEKTLFIENTQMHTREYWENNKDRYKMVCETLSSKGILLTTI